MEVINMGILPKNINFTDLLNHKFEAKPTPAPIKE